MIANTVKVRTGTTKAPALEVKMSVFLLDQEVSGDRLPVKKKIFVNFFLSLKNHWFGI